MSNEISDEFCSAMRCECSKCNPPPRNDTGSEISDEAILKAALQNDFEGFITVNSLGTYCVGDFVKVNREQALAAQAEIDAANEVTDEMIDAALRAQKSFSMTVRMDYLKRNREEAKLMIIAALKAKTK